MVSLLVKIMQKKKSEIHSYDFIGFLLLTKKQNSLTYGYDVILLITRGYHYSRY
ncbi:hypothetical protein HanIR_Chr15g0779821 [Helianthus annuus]|nr:hypothetical protein HanIR_Chr15g0779821 [Helianthus annuus]